MSSSSLPAHLRSYEARFNAAQSKSVEFIEDDQAELDRRFARMLRRPPVFVQPEHVARARKVQYPVFERATDGRDEEDMVPREIPAQPKLSAQERMAAELRDMDDAIVGDFKKEAELLADKTFRTFFDVTGELTKIKHKAVYDAASLATSRTRVMNAPLMLPIDPSKMNLNVTALSTALLGWVTLFHDRAALDVRKMNVVCAEHYRTPKCPEFTKLCTTALAETKEITTNVFEMVTDRLARRANGESVSMAFKPTERQMIREVLDGSKETGLYEHSHARMDLLRSVMTDKSVVIHDVLVIQVKVAMAMIAGARFVDEYHMPDAVDQDAYERAHDIAARLGVDALIDIKRPSLH